MATVSQATRVLDAPVISQDPLAPEELAAIHVAGKKFDATVRGALQPGEYQVFRRLVIRGAVRVGQPTEASGAPDYQGVLAAMFARLPAGQRAAVARWVASEEFQVDQVDRAAVRELCAPTVRRHARAGSVSGIVRVSLEG